MDGKQTTPDQTPTEQATVPYEPPQIESVLTADDLAREVQYAGAQSRPPQ